MHRAKRFFYVCAGLFLIALSYHFGAISAQAQGPGQIGCVHMADGAGVAAVIGRNLWLWGPSAGVTEIADPIPGTADVIACGLWGVTLANGEVWSASGYPPTGPWTLTAAFPLGGATPTSLHSLGQLKALYRSPAPGGR